MKPSGPGLLDAAGTRGVGSRAYRPAPPWQEHPLPRVHPGPATRGLYGFWNPADHAHGGLQELAIVPISNAGRGVRMTAPVHASLGEGE